MVDSPPTAHEQHTKSSSEPAADAQVQSSGPATATLRLPFGSLSVSLPQVSARVGGQPVGAGQGAGGTRIERLALYGGAAALGALGVLEWPVVLAAAASTYVLSRLTRGARGEHSQLHAPHIEHDHVHGMDCGHAVVPHGDHSDYLHDGHRHAAHDDHWDEH